MGFTHTTGNSANNGSSAQSLAVTLGGAPAAGSLVCVGVAVIASVSGFATGLTVKDSNNNSYTMSPNSPQNTAAPANGGVWLFYLLSAPANASATITATWTNFCFPSIWADVFAVTGGTAVFDVDAAAGTTSSGTTINTPTITPTQANELLFSTAMAGAAAGLTAPAAGATLGVWTGAGGAIRSKNMSEYDLSASSTQAVQYTQSSSGWGAMAMAFGIVSSVPTGWDFNAPLIRDVYRVLSYQ